MIRFIPDTWRDALWRPLAMAAPDAGVYVEIMAPDLRFVMLALLTAAAVLGLRRWSYPCAVWLLLGFVWLAFVPWMITTGNGRYFIAVLLVVGPLCVALIHRLPLSRSLRVTMAAGAVSLQLFVLAQSGPWGWWGLTSWGQSSYFDVALPQSHREQAATYVTISSISYSLIAPQFAAQSSWINLSSLRGDRENSIDDRRAQVFLEGAAQQGMPLRLLVPTMPSYMTDDRQPTSEMRREIDRMLGPHRLALSATASCEIVRSRGLAGVVLKKPEEASDSKLSELGFWICPLRFPVEVPPVVSMGGDSRQADRVFQKLEQDCPRIFHPGEARSVRVGDGFSRTYPSSDTKAYVLDDGQVLYKYWRALNPGLVGTVDSVLAPNFKMDCNSIRGRSNLPWERVL